MISHPFSVAEWLNFLSIPIGTQMIQAVMFWGPITIFFLCFGNLAIPAETVANWIGETPNNYIFAGIALPFSTVLLKVSLLIGAFAGLNFVASTSSDERYVQDFLRENLEYLQSVIMMRNIYLQAQNKR